MYRTQKGYDTEWFLTPSESPIFLAGLAERMIDSTRQ